MRPRFVWRDLVDVAQVLTLLNRVPLERLARTDDDVKVDASNANGESTSAATTSTRVNDVESVLDRIASTRETLPAAAPAIGVMLERLLTAIARRRNLTVEKVRCDVWRVVDVDVDVDVCACVFNVYRLMTC
jgi:hypothetical protein